MRRPKPAPSRGSDGTVLRAPLVLILLLTATVGRGQTAPPGACVAVPAARYVVHRTTTQASPPDPEYPFESSRDLEVGPTALDLDGDGGPDQLVPAPLPGDCTEDMHVDAYWVRGSCGHRVGTLIGRPTATRRRSHGLFDLETSVEETVQDDPRVPAVRRTHRRTYRFDGAAYREVSHTVSDAVCHHCPLERCTTEPR